MKNTWILAMSFCLGCSSHPASNAQDAGADSSMGTFGTSACATCVNGACQQAESSCASDAACAGYLECLNACPTDSIGNIEAACESACAMPSGSSGTLAESYDACRTAGLGAACTACGGDASAVGDAAPDIPYINEQCSGSKADDSSACNYCQSTKCCQVLATLEANNTDFQAMATCINACTTDAGTADPTCLNACFQAHPAGLAAYAPFQACVDVNCYSECPPTPTKCNICSFTTCGTNFAECEGVPDCFEALYCTGDQIAGDTQALDACLAEFPDGMTEYDNLAACVTAKCSGPCPQ